MRRGRTIGLQAYLTRTVLFFFVVFISTMFLVASCGQDSFADPGVQIGRIYRKVYSPWVEKIAEVPLQLDQMFLPLRAQSAKRDDVFLLSLYTSDCQAVSYDLSGQLLSTPWLDCPRNNDESPPVVVHGLDKDAVATLDGYPQAITIFEPGDDRRFHAIPIQVPYPASTILPGDVNGDGLEDIFVLSTTGGIFSVVYAPFTKSSQAVEAGFLNPMRDWALHIVGDWNGDGRADLAAMDHSQLTPEYQAYQWWYMLAGADSWFTPRAAEGFTPNPWGPPAVVRLKGDSRDWIAVPEMEQASWWLVRDSVVPGYVMHEIFGQVIPRPDSPAQRGPTSIPESEQLLAMHFLGAVMVTLELPISEDFTPLNPIPIFPLRFLRFRLAELNGGGTKEIVGADESKLYVSTLHMFEPFINVSIATQSGEIVRTNFRGIFSRKVEASSEEFRPIGYKVRRTIEIPRPAQGAPSVAYVLEPEEDPDGPKTCVGFNPENGSWGRGSLWCPANYAYIEVDDTLHQGNIVGVCCPLPRRDIFSDSEVVVDEMRCPPDHVAVGMTKTEPSKAKLRCAGINQKKYRLSEPSAGAYWGLGSKTIGAEKGIARETLPASIRYAVGRSDLKEWDVDGCFGQPLGGVLVGKLGKHCSDMLFSTILEIDKDGTLKPIKMFPDCSRISDPFDPNASCL